MRVFVLPEGRSPREQGRAHGEAFRPLVRELAEIRLQRTVEQTGIAAEDVLRLAEAHLPLLRDFDEGLHDELVGIGEGAGIGEALGVVLNHYTDLKDLRPHSPAVRELLGEVKTVGEPEGPDGRHQEGCSALYVDGADGPLLAQTWDMHGSAEPYVMVLGVPAEGGRPGAWLLTVVGCVGMAGLNDRGLGVTINNLRSGDARFGVVWPALVRAMLARPSLGEAWDLLQSAPLGAGHHYMLASAEGMASLESSAERKEALRGPREPTEAFVHTNHCLSARIGAISTVPEGSTTFERYRFLEGRLAAGEGRDRASLWALLGSHEGYPRSVCTHLAGPQAPHAMLTCGATLMDLRARRMYAARGCIHGARPHRFEFPVDESSPW